MAFSRFNRKPTSTVTTSTPFPILILNLVLRFLQFVFAITVIGLYGTDLHKGHKENKYTDSKWGYAVAIGALSAFTALVYVIPKVKSWWAFGWDIVLFILWTAVFGIFGKLYIHENPEGKSGIKRMKNAVWIDLVNMLLWLFSSIMAVVLFFTMRGGRTLHTGRAAA